MRYSIQAITRRLCIQSSINKTSTYTIQIRGKIIKFPLEKEPLEGGKWDA